MERWTLNRKGGMRVDGKACGRSALARGEGGW